MCLTDRRDYHNNILYETNQSEEWSLGSAAASPSLISCTYGTDCLSNHLSVWVVRAFKAYQVLFSPFRGSRTYTSLRFAAQPARHEPDV
jgi:hypothetical protein